MEIESAMFNLMDVVPPGSDPLLTHVTSQQLEYYLLQMIPQVDALQRMHESFYEYYVCTAAQKFLFYLDPRKTNSIAIKKIAHSKAMEELLHLRKLANQVAQQQVELVDVEYQVGIFIFNLSEISRHIY